MKQIVKQYRLIGTATDWDETRLQNSQESYNAALQLFDPSTLSLFESFHVIYLTTGNHVKGYMKIADGSLNAVVVDVRRIIIGALESLSTAIVVAHNHPSGDIKPSLQDRQLTQKLQDACNLFGIQLQDHLILGNGDYYSFREQGNIIN